MNMQRIFVILACLCLSSAVACSQNRCVDYSVKVLSTYPHDASAYTQGLFFHEGQLYESTGQYGQSSLRKVDLESGKVQFKKEFNRKYFGEGSCIAAGKLYMLTWTNKVAFVYDPVTLEYEKTYAYPREGWGLAAVPSDAADALPEGTVMVASDGSGSLFYLDSELKTLKKINVTMDGRNVRLLNELEWIDGKIWANVYTTDLILVINPSTGAVEGRVDCSDLYPRARRSPDADVLNGIACDARGNIYLTGKNWPKMYRIQLVRK